MRNIGKLLLLLVVYFASILILRGQDKLLMTHLDSTFTFTEFIGYVKEYHPVIKQADLKLTIAEGKLLEARGGFDPKIEVDYDRKKFKSTEYYDILNGTFKIPTWFGLEFKASYDQATGDFLNPDLTVPDDGLYAVGVSLDVAQGLLTNDRMAMLRKSKFFLQRSLADRELQINNILYEATLSYLEWYEAYMMEQIYRDFLDNAEERLKGIKARYESGDLAQIDVTEAQIAIRNRRLALNNAKIKQLKAKLKVSTFLWIDYIPVELQGAVMPVLPSFDSFKNSILLSFNDDKRDWLENHPKLKSIGFKMEEQEIEKRLATNKLLPRLTLNYNFLNTNYDTFNQFNTDDYKMGLEFSFPIFLRRERGELKVANAILEDIKLEQLNTSLKLETAFETALLETENLESQLSLIQDIVGDYSTLLQAEERKLELGESSLFLVNTREQRLIDNLLKNTEIQVDYLASIAKLLNINGQAISP